MNTSALGVFEHFSTSLYVGDLGMEATEKDLRAAFEKYGKLISYKVCRHPHTKKSLGYGFVSFLDDKDAVQAMKEVNYTRILGENEVTVMQSKSDPSDRRDEKLSVRVENLDKISKKSFHTHFAQYGKILGSRIFRNRKVGQVHFHTKESAATAIAKSNFLEGQQLAVSSCKWERNYADSVEGESVEADSVEAEPAQASGNVGKCKLYVGNLEKDLKVEELSALFSNFGEVRNRKIFKRSNKPRAGWVSFYNEEDATAAIKKFNEENFKGKKYSVSYFRKGGSKTKKDVAKAGTPADKTLGVQSKPILGGRGGSGQKVKKTNVKSRSHKDELKTAESVGDASVVTAGSSSVTAGVGIHVGGPSRKDFVKLKFFTKNLNRKFLFEHFSRYGTVTHLKTEPVYNYGFVRFQTSIMAEKALRAIDENKEVDVYVKMAVSHYVCEAESGGRSKVNLYVKHLGRKVVDDTLYKEFGKFGEIIKAKVVTVNNESKGYGFVCYSNAKDAQKAYECMNGVILHSKKLYVSFYQKKKYRQQFLKSRYLQCTEKRT